MTGREQAPLQIYRQLLAAYGERHWWPADTVFEVMVGAVLTQNTRWENVKMAIANLKQAGMLDAERICNSNRKQLAEYIRPSGFFRQKSRYLQAMSLFYYHHGCESGLKKWSMSNLRKTLLTVQGIGPETADSMLLYALEKPIFVVDAYTRRIFNRLGHLPQDADYRHTQHYFHSRLPRSLPLFKEFHALIVEHAKRHCRVTPRCEDCPLRQHCLYAEQHVPSCDSAHEKQSYSHVEQAAD
ncbi:MAG: endonuclease III domain-containing protein [Mariprofundaceae bacterium]|nr:endonuclease III domain-containing protein [Mariprofundaceae bacterium]